jgi:hypothetical protein
MVHPKLESTQSLSVKTPMNKQEKSSGSSQVNLPLINQMPQALIWVQIGIG